MSRESKSEQRSSHSDEGRSSREERRRDRINERKDSDGSRKDEEKDGERKHRHKEKKEKSKDRKRRHRDEKKEKKQKRKRRDSEAGPSRRDSSSDRNRRSRTRSRSRSYHRERSDEESYRRRREDRGRNDDRSIRSPMVYRYSSSPEAYSRNRSYNDRTRRNLSEERGRWNRRSTTSGRSAAQARYALLSQNERELARKIAEDTNRYNFDISDHDDNDRWVPDPSYDKYRERSKTRSESPLSPIRNKRASPRNGNGRTNLSSRSPRRSPRRSPTPPKYSQSSTTSVPKKPVDCLTLSSDEEDTGPGTSKLPHYVRVLTASQPPQTKEEKEFCKMIAPSQSALEKYRREGPEYRPPPPPIPLPPGVLTPSSDGFYSRCDLPPDFAEYVERNRRHSEVTAAAAADIVPESSETAPTISDKAPEDTVAAEGEEGTIPEETEADGSEQAVSREESEKESVPTISDKAPEDTVAAEGEEERVPEETEADGSKNPDSGEESVHGDAAPVYPESPARDDVIDEETEARDASGEREYVEYITDSGEELRDRIAQCHYPSGPSAYGSGYASHGQRSGDKEGEEQETNRRFVKTEGMNKSEWESYVNFHEGVQPSKLVVDLFTGEAVIEGQLGRTTGFTKLEHLDFSVRCNSTFRVKFAEQNGPAEVLLDNKRIIRLPPVECSNRQRRLRIDGASIERSRRGRSLSPDYYCGSPGMCDCNAPRSHPTPDHALANAIIEGQYRDWERSELFKREDSLRKVKAPIKEGEEEDWKSKQDRKRNEQREEWGEWEDRRMTRSERDRQKREHQNYRTECRKKWNKEKLKEEKRKKEDKEFLAVAAEMRKMVQKRRQERWKIEDKERRAEETRD